MKKAFRKLIVFAMALAMMLPVLGTLKAEAATKPRLSTKKMTIAVGKYNDLSYCSNTRDGNGYLYVSYAIEGAKYTFKSSKTAVVTVKGDSTGSAKLTGVKPGSATITVTQKYKGKTTTVGKCKVTVKAATMKAGYTADNGVALGRDIVLSYDSGFGLCEFNYFNPSAKYTFTSDSENFQMSMKKEQLGEYFWYDQVYTATEAGTYTVTVTETYKKKTRDLGTFQVTIADLKPADTAEAWVGESFQLPMETTARYRLRSYEVEWDPVDMLELVPENDYDRYVMPKKAGTVVVSYYASGAKEGEKGRLLGKTTITVKEYGED